MIAWIYTCVVEISISKNYYYLIIDAFKNRGIGMARMFLKIFFALGFSHRCGALLIHWVMK